ncbi:DUF7619 domain-containing protein [Flavobacterium microcysteis]|uniref:T9SS type A sorting domain-containing protein n=1 Tax=Flavobacterium microcysteis TaxID=2596891 RepID=A0A501QEJ9_9FLAO|nr:T9SS type A sorting domain-containing protein [Flavobacterium microcysteis]TPD70547.1 T9SS type A sorting domain-containing protein [Flavobacterium microcysteis]
MKKLYYAFLVFCLWQGMYGQGLYIPDANFKAKLLAADASNEIAKNRQGEYIRIDSNRNGEIEVTEAMVVNYLNVSSAAISDLRGIEYFDAITTLICNNNQLVSIPTSDLPLLTFLQCADNKIVSLDLTPCPKLYSLSCANNRLENLVLNNPSLNFIDCQHNNLVSLNVNNSLNLEYLYCSYNSIATLALSECLRLRDLECSFNQLTVLDLTRQTRLRDLQCNNNQLGLLQLAGNFIKKLYCNNNQLRQLNLSTQIALEELNCSNNILTSLNLTGLNRLKRVLMQNNQVASLNDLVDYPELVSMIADNNKLSSLTVSCPSIAELSIAYNQLESLRIYGCRELSIRGLNFRNNPLTLLDVRGFERLTSLSCNNYGLTSALTVIADEGLQSLSFNGNRLQSLDISQCPGVEILSFESNPLLTSLFVKNGKDNTVSLEQSLVNTPYLRYICADEDEINTIKTQLAVRSGFECEVNSYCSFTPGGRFNIVKSNTTFDFNRNGCDSEDIAASFAGYKVIQGETETIYFSDKSGQYNLPLLDGNTTIIPLLANPNYFEVSPPSVTYTSSEQQEPFEQLFCLKHKGEYADLEISILPLGDAVPGYTSNYAISYRNKGTNIQSGTIELQFNTAVYPESFSLSEASQDPERLSWSFSNLKPFESRTIPLRFRLNSPADSPALNSGDILNYKATITSSTSLDTAPEDNLAILRQTVVNSFDPNDKTCLQGLSVSTSYIGQYIHYIIRFENTGNFVAKNIVVKDLIDVDRFDMTSLSPIESSHTFITKVDDNNTIEFVFKDIDLPFYDHINDGYIAFKIKTKSSLAAGDSFSNGASIYFDFNLPVMTERVVTTIDSLGDKDHEFSSRFTISPNPAKDILTITNKDELQMKSVAIYNMMGQPVMMISNNSDSSNAFDISDLASGNYIVKIYSDEGIATRKFIKY